MSVGFLRTWLSVKHIPVQHPNIAVRLRNEDIFCTRAAVSALCRLPKENLESLVGLLIKARDHRRQAEPKFSFTLAELPPYAALVDERGNPRVNWDLYRNEHKLFIMFVREFLPAGSKKMRIPDPPRIYPSNNDE